MERGSVRDFPHDDYPRGWYRVAWSFELTHTVQAISYFEHDFVAYRTSDGVAHVLDAFCPHLGAHLGYGGRLEDDQVVCPFHGWTWDRSGRNTSIPYEHPDVRKKTIRTWPVREVGGAVLIWWSDSPGAAEWEPEPIAEESDDGFHTVGPQTCVVWERKHLIPQALTENIADPAHLKYVHLAKSVPSIATEQTASTFVSSLDYVFGEGRTSTWLTPEGPRAVHLVAEAHGLGYTISRYGGLHGAVHLLGATPTDRHHADVWASAVVPRSPDDAGDTLGAWGTRLVKEMFKSHEQDFPVWEHMTYIAHPPYARMEGCHKRLRRWAEAFYA